MNNILSILSHPFSGQNKLAYTPEVCRRITWAIIVDTRSYFDDIKLADDFLHCNGRMQFPISTLDGDYMNIKHGIKTERIISLTSGELWSPLMATGYQERISQERNQGEGSTSNNLQGCPPSTHGQQRQPMAPRPRPITGNLKILWMDVTQNYRS
jgi:hypothetical protein